MGVANADGFAIGVPLLAVVVAFSVSRRDPVELDASASARPAISRQMFKESFIARTGERDNKHIQLMLF
jgi:Zn-dependent membrane protease YugP